MPYPQHSTDLDMTYEVKTRCGKTFLIFEDDVEYDIDEALIIADMGDYPECIGGVTAKKTDILAIHAIKKAFDGVILKNTANTLLRKGRKSVDYPMGMMIAAILHTKKREFNGSEKVVGRKIMPMAYKV